MILKKNSLIGGKNTYISQLPIYKKLVLKMIHRRFFIGIWIMAKIRSFVKGRYR